MLNEEDIGYVDFSLSLHRHSALIQSHYQYYHTAVLPKVKDETTENSCENVLVYNGKASCDPDSVFALETTGGSQEKVEILPTDRSLGQNLQAPVAVLYADLESESFHKFHSHLSASALNGKIQYIIRYKPPKDLESRPKENLSGYGLELALKRTDYLVIDDRDTGSSGGKKVEDEEAENNLENDNEESPTRDKKVSGDDVLSEDAGQSVSKAKLPTLGYRAANYIMHHKNPFEALVNVSLDFPKYSGAIADLQPERSVFKDVKQNAMNGIINPGQNSILINGAPAFPVDDSVYTLLDILDRERNFVKSLSELGLDATEASSLINKNILGETVADVVNRYDYRATGLVWLNNIEVDEQYKNWPEDTEMYLDRNHPGQFYPVRHNTNSLVFTVDFSNPSHLEILTQAFSILSRGLPVQVGVIPLTNTYEGKIHAANLHYLVLNYPTKAILTYVTGVMSELDANEAMINVLKGDNIDVTPDDQPEVVQILEDSKDWEGHFDIDTSEMVIFANGHLIEPSNSWIYEASSIFQNDLEIIRDIISTGKRDPTMSLRDHFIADGLTRRNKLINPTDPASIKYMDTKILYEHLEGLLDYIPSLQTGASSTDDHSFTTLWFFADFANSESLSQVINLVEFVSHAKEKKHIKIHFVPIIDRSLKQTSIREKRAENVVTILQLLNRIKDTDSLENSLVVLNALYEYHFGQKKKGVPAPEDKHDSLKDFGLDENFQILKSSENIRAGLPKDVSSLLSLYKGLQKGVKLIVDGRIVPIPTVRQLDFEEIRLLVDREQSSRTGPIINEICTMPQFASLSHSAEKFQLYDKFVARYTKTFHIEGRNEFFISSEAPRINTQDLTGDNSLINVTDNDEATLRIVASIDPISETGQKFVTYVQALSKLPNVSVKLFINPEPKHDTIPLKRFYRASIPSKPSFDSEGSRKRESIVFPGLSKDTLYNLEIHTPSAWMVNPAESIYDLENIILENVKEDSLKATYELRHILLEGHCRDVSTGGAPRGIGLDLGTEINPQLTDTIVMANLGYMQFQANPGLWLLNTKPGRSSEIYNLDGAGVMGFDNIEDKSNKILMSKMTGATIFPRFSRKKGKEREDVLQKPLGGKSMSFLKNSWNKVRGYGSDDVDSRGKQADINIFTVASGHLYERFLSIMTASVMKHTNQTVKFWLIGDFLSPSFKEFVPYLAEREGFEYEFVAYKWPHWLRSQSEKQRTIWGYKILFLDTLFPQSLDKVIFVDADQIVRTDLQELVDMDLDGAPYGYTPMCDSRAEIEGFRFWKQGFWKKFLGEELKYHISALYVVDLVRFRELAAGDRLRQHYQQLSADPESLSNLDQDLPNHMQRQIPIFSLPQDWLWCETWCSDASLETAKTIDLCNNPMTKEPKLDRAKRQVPEWIEYDDEIAKLNEEFKLMQENQAKLEKIQVIKDSKDNTAQGISYEGGDDFIEHDEL